MRPTGTPAPDVERTLDLMRDVVRQARGAVLWVRDNAFAADASMLSVGDAQEICDHADEAEESLLGPLEALHPHIKQLDEEAAAAELERLEEDAGPRRPRVRKKALMRELRETLEEALEHVGVAAPYGVGALSEPGTGFSSEQIEEMWRDFASAKESVEAALQVLDPNRFSRELHVLDDVERVERAAEVEQIELRREIVRRAGNP